MLIDVTRLLSRLMEGKLPTGVDRVSLAYVQHFASRAVALLRYGGRWIEFNKSDSQAIFEAVLNPDIRFANTVRSCVARNYLLGWSNKRKNRILLNTGHSGLNDSDYAIAAQRKEFRPVFFLHDLIPIAYPEYSRPGEAEKHDLRLKTMRAVGCGLILNSNATQTALVTYADANGWVLPPTVVAPLAPPIFPAIHSERLSPEPYFVVLGTIEARKNHLLLLNLWRQLIEENLGVVPRLVLIGQRGWESEQVVDMLERCESLRDHVIEVSRCTDAQLAGWLQHAQALLFPSFAEGFGIPLVEAFSLGLPVIASNLPVFREIAGNVPEYLDPIDGLGWKQMIRDYTDTAHPRRLAQLERIAKYKIPTWGNHFVLVEQLLEHINV